MEIRVVMYNGKETDYHISDTGIVFGKNGKPMKERYMPNGYMQACLRIDKVYRYLYIHRIVYEAFVKQIPPCMEINHKDGCKTNNSLSNLEMVTHIENIGHSWKHELAYKHNSHKRKHLEARLTKTYGVESIRKACSYLEKTIATYAEISKKTNIPVWIIYQLANGKLWVEISSGYDIKTRAERRAEFYKKRDAKIMDMRSDGYTIQDIADEIGISFDAVARRMALMRKRKEM